MQNDRHNLTVILVEKNCEKMHCIQRYLHFFVHFSSLVLQISRDTMHFLAIFFSKNNREIEPVGSFFIILDTFDFLAAPFNFFLDLSKEDCL